MALARSKSARDSRCISDTAREQGVPAYVILHDKTLRELAEYRPVSHGLLAQISGMGSAKIEHYGEELLQLIRATESQAN